MMQAYVMLCMYRRDPEANSFLRYQPEQMLRSAIHHARQAAVVKALLDKGGAARPPKQTAEA